MYTLLPVSCITLYVLLVYLGLGSFMLLPVYYIQLAEAFTEQLMIDDIDSTDDPNFCDEYAEKIYKYLRELEI